jgi:hypothetical protein
MLVMLVGASIATAGAGASVPRKTVAARWTLWELKQRSLYFKTELAPRRVRSSVPSPGLLRFTQRHGPVHGRIICRLSTKRSDRNEYGCGWLITVDGKARYRGAALVTLYLSGSGFDISFLYSSCTSLRGSSFCRTHRPPHPG